MDIVVFQFIEGMVIVQSSLFFLFLKPDENMNDKSMNTV